MTDEELIKRLRDGSYALSLERVAADRIEGLMWERDEARDAAVMWQEDFIEMNERWDNTANLLDKAVELIRALRLTARPFDTGDTDHDNAMRAADALLAEIEG